MADSLEQIIQVINSGDVEKKVEAMQHLNKYLQRIKEVSLPDGNFNAVLVLPNLLPLLQKILQKDGFVALQLEAVLVMTNILQIYPDFAHQILKSGAISRLIFLMGCRNIYVCTKSVQILGLIAIQDENCRNQLLKEGVMDPLLRLLNNRVDIGFLRHATKTLSRLFIYKPIPALQLARKCLHTLCCLIYSLDEEISANACWALSHISVGKNYLIQVILEYGVEQRLVELLMHPSVQVQESSLRVIGNIATGDDQQTQLILNCGLLGALLQLINHRQQSIRKETCWIISNILAGNKVQVEAVFEAGIMPHIIRWLSFGGNEVKRECIWCIANALETVEQHQMQYMVSLGCVKSLCDQLNAEQDTRIATITLQSLEKILKAGEQQSQQFPESYKQNMGVEIFKIANGFTIIKHLQQQHPSDAVRGKAMKIWETYFQDKEGEEQETQNAAVNKNFNQLQNQIMQNNIAIQQVQINDKMRFMQINDCQDEMEDWEIVEKMEDFDIIDSE